MPAFQHHFFNGLLASAEQIRARIRRYVAPFDSELRANWGVTATEALQVADWITKHLQQALDAASELAKEERTGRLAIRNEPAASLEELRARAKASAYVDIAAALTQAIHRRHKLRHSDLTAQFGATGGACWGRFTVARGEGEPLTYPTEQSIAEVRPLILLCEEEAMCLSGNALFLALLPAVEETLLASPSRDRFLSARDAARRRPRSRCADWSALAPLCTRASRSGRMGSTSTTWG